jgi:hypothetical protein
MKTATRILSVICLFGFIQTGVAQKSVKEYVTKTKKEKIQKSIVVIGQPVSSSVKSFQDGHSKWPLLTSKDQLPDTVALITFNISDLGLTSSWANDYARYTEYFSLSETGGNLVANEMLSQTIGTLKEEFRKQGVVLLTIGDILDTQEKMDYYYSGFTPTVSKLGKFLSNVENRATDISVCADYYRYFDMGATFDHLRSESLGHDLANSLGVDAVLSVGFEVQSNKKEMYLRAVKMALHAPNPLPKEDKKYIAQKAGNGYYYGQLFVGGGLRFKKPFKTVEIKKKQITSMDFEGLDVVLQNMLERFYSEMHSSIDKAAKAFD